MIINPFGTKPTPRWIIFFLDVFFSFFSIFLAYQLRFNFNIPSEEVRYYLQEATPIFLVIRIACFYFSKIYTGIIRYTSTRDGQRVFIVTFIGSMLLCLVNAVTYVLQSKFVFPFSVIIMEFLGSLFFLITYRIAVKVLYFELKNPIKERSRIMIFGAGEAALITARALDRDAGSKFNVVGFIDDNKKKIGKRIEGVTVYDGALLDDILKQNDVGFLIISPQNISVVRKQTIIEACVTHNVKVLNVPPATKWINGELSFKQIKKISIEDLLGRDTIQLDETKIRALIQNKIVLVTGAAGSIGSGLVRQIIKYNPTKLILLDVAESPLYDIEMELQELANKTNAVEIVIGDVRNVERMRNLFATFMPQVVFHAAAYKHVPMMENNPAEAVYTNIHGTRVMADMAVEFNVQKFVMISTDKAVNPTNVMGASKRIAEMYVQALNTTTSTQFITTRFGNVLGSNGSVIPRFKKQIDAGGPITLTHPDITRFFMTIPEACQLVLEAATMGNGGEIFVFDMGQSVKILDLAKKMIRLSGLELGKDIQIIYTGLRPGEKLYEELLNNAENTLPTHHELILIGKVRPAIYADVKIQIDELTALIPTQHNLNIVRKMKQIVPEYVSNNSLFEQLDTPKT
jgi:FlaA1/EpsC-like NDP-sugar epimerase